MSPTLSESDSGELATVQAVWGIAHPTGYPFFSLIGYIFSFLPIPLAIISKLNLLCVIWNTLTVIFLIRTIKLILENISDYATAKDRRKFQGLFLSEKTIAMASVFAGLSFAFSTTFWSQSIKIEVYSLQIFLSVVILFYSTKVYLKETDGKSYFKGWIIIALLLGLSFANHLMTLYLLPALIYFYFYKNSLNRRSITSLFFLAVITFLISTSFYLMMMFRAQSGPAYVFGQPTDILSLIDHVRGRDYSQYMFQGLEIVKKQSKQFLEILSFNPERSTFIGGEFSFSIIFVLCGAILSFIFIKRLFLFLFLIMATSLFFAFNYSIPDINEYFLVVFLCFSIFSSIFIVFSLIILKSKIIKSLIAILVAFLVFSQILLNYKELDRSNYYFVEDYIKAVVNSLPPNAVLVTNDWDFILSPGLFVQNVEKLRKDEELTNLHLLNFKWYKKELKNKYKDIQEFLSTEYYIGWDIIRDLILKNKFSLNPNQKIIPDILTFKVINNNDYHPASDPLFKIRFQKKRNSDENYYYELITYILESRIRYELSFNKIDRAKLYLNKLSIDFPDFKIPSDLMHIPSK
jgi:hypothetical protein